MNVCKELCPLKTNGVEDCLENCEIIKQKIKQLEADKAELVEAIEKIKNNAKQFGVLRCYSKYLEKQNKLMLDALIKVWQGHFYYQMCPLKDTIRITIEKITQKKIEEII